jgi:hypothetical protein
VNVRLLTIFAIVTPTGLLALIIASVYPTTTTGFVKGHKCISSDGNSGAVSTCDADKKSSFFSSDPKQVCRESADKCSSAQTGFVEFGNWKKLDLIDT